ncbi:MAG: TRAP transporter small permease [Tistlia sp.]|uniref:TRAP transporter small permease n=1 Tax=Tistlia sp. TaxID=3057121 RepID=UPI0034A21448
MIIDWAAMGLLVGLIVVTVIGVLDRFLLNLGLTWTEELARFLLVWTSFIAAVVAARHRQHFKVELLSRRFGRYGTQAIALLCLLASVTVCFYGVRLTLFFDSQTSPALGVPMSAVYASVPVSFALISFYLLRDLVRPRDDAARHSETLP